MTKAARKSAHRRSCAVPKWAKPFLAELAATSNVSAAARKAGFKTTVPVYEARKASAEFSRMWNEALCEGYDLLELELLKRLREGEVKPARDARRGVRSFDNATALRLLVAHRQSAARQRALRDNDDTEAILAGINARLEGIKQRRKASEREPGSDGE
jgi:hypothetical protein